MGPTARRATTDGFVALTEVAVVEITLLGVVAAVLLVWLWHMRRRFAERRRQLTGEIADSATRAEERAHNQITLDEAEIAALARDGVDVARPRSAVGEARAAFDRREFHRALELARHAHDSLVGMRRAGGMGISSSGSPALAQEGGGARAERTGDPPGGAGDEARGIPAEGSVRAPLARNRMESKFQITLLTEELVAAVRGGPDRPEVAEANRQAAEARALAEREEYTEALRVALRARRLLGARLETLAAPAAPSAGGPAAGPPTPPVDGGVPSGEPAVRPEASSASRGPSTIPSGSAPAAPECERCHQPLREGDVFCRACGAPAGARRCPRCGVAAEAGDRFCARCGTVVS